MADFTVVAANVIASSLATTEDGVAGATLTAGEVLAQDTDGGLKLADANAAAPLNVVKGIALHAAFTGQPMKFVKADPNFKPGFAVTVGIAVILSANPGKMAPDADKAAGWFVTELGRAVNTTDLRLFFVPVGVAIP